MLDGVAVKDRHTGRAGARVRRLGFLERAVLQLGHRDRVPAAARCCKRRTTGQRRGGDTNAEHQPSHHQSNASPHRASSIMAEAPPANADSCITVPASVTPTTGAARAGPQVRARGCVADTQTAHKGHTADLSVSERQRSGWSGMRQAADRAE